MPETEHYLRRELYELVRGDSRIFEFLQGGSLDGIWYWDLLNPEHEWMSPRFCEVFGYEADEIPHTSAWWQDNIHPDDLPATLENFERHKNNPDHPYDQVVRYRHKMGGTVWVRCRGLIVRDEGGVPSRMLGCHTDMTRYMELAEELRRSSLELGQFAYVASHDLQEPLRMNANFTEMFLESVSERVALTEEEKEYASFAIDGAHRAQRLVAGLMTYSRAGRDMKGEAFKLADAVEEGLGALNGLLAERSGTVEYGGLPTVWGDFAAVSRLFQNLIGNALKFRSSDRNPHVAIHAEREGHQWRVSVADNGDGFEQKYAEKVFEVFKRLGSKKNGDGLGLAVCKRIVERHRGRIWAESEPGQGATFFFTLPRGPE